MMILGVSGKLHTGKTVLTNQIIDLMPSTAVRYGFADALKRECAERFKFPLHWCYDQKLKGLKVSGTAGVMTVREILQWWGTDVRRAEDPDYWVKKALGTLPDVDIVIMDDVRFPNEADAIRAAGGRLIRLEPYPGWTGHSTHTSETALDDYRNWDLLLTLEYGQLEAAARIVVDKMPPVWLGNACG